MIAHRRFLISENFVVSLLHSHVHFFMTEFYFLSCNLIRIFFCYYHLASNNFNFNSLCGFHGFNHRIPSCYSNTSGSPNTVNFYYFLCDGSRNSLRSPGPFPNLYFCCLLFNRCHSESSWDCLSTSVFDCYFSSFCAPFTDYMGN